MLRTNFSSFSQLIAQGVEIDGHPALTQIFLWFYSAWVGIDPRLVKLPFLLAGLLSVWLVYAISAQMFDKRAALVSASLFSVAQYAVIYAQLARPYAFAAMFLMSAFLCLLKFEAKGNRKYLLFYALFAALTAYTHYMAILQLTVISVIWWTFRLNGKQRREFMLAGIFSAMLFLPHAGITLKHLAIGGIGHWLRPPKMDFAWHLISFSFNHSLLLAAPFVLCLLTLFIRRNHLKTQALMAASWVIPFVIVFVYSVKVNPLMHESSMFFTFPFLVMLVGSAYTNFNRKLAVVTSVYVVAIGAHNLFFERNHVQLAVKSEFQDPVRWFNKAEMKSNTTAVFDLREDGAQLLDQAAIENFDGIRFFENFKSLTEFLIFMDSLKQDQMLIVTNPASHGSLLAFSALHFQHLVQLKGYQSCAAYLLSASGKSDLQVLGQLTNPQALKGEEYSQTVTVNVRGIEVHTNVLGAVKFNSENAHDQYLVMNFRPNSGIESWYSVELQEYILPGAKEHLAAFSFDMRDFSNWTEGGELQLYVWNKAHSELIVNELTVYSFPANQWRYRLYN